jgi:hypothetical protein
VYGNQRAGDAEVMSLYLRINRARAAWRFTTPPTRFWPRNPAPAARSATTKTFKSVEALNARQMDAAGGAALRRVLDRKDECSTSCGAALLGRRGGAECDPPRHDGGLIVGIRADGRHHYRDCRRRRRQLAPKKSCATNRTRASSGRRPCATQSDNQRTVEHAG